MFDIPDVKIFKDSVHGYIRIPTCFVEHLIDTEIFQRLRNIDQTGMRVLYPNAKHDRFSHSLGVFHLGCKAVDALLENFAHEDYWNISSDNKKLIFWAKNKILFLIACLLHDIGHTPFSHSLENIVLLNSGGSVNFTKELIEKIVQNEGWGEQVNKIEASAHEKMGAMLIIDKLQENIEHIFDELIQWQYPVIGAGNILYAEHYNYNPVIDKEHLQRDIYFIARMILGLKYTGYEPEKQIRNCFIELLNGGNFDVDKLDYVVRDTQMSGISNTNVDIDRLLSSVCIITKTKYMDQAFVNEKFSNCVISQLSGGENSEITIEGCFRGDILLKSNAEVVIARESTFLSLTPIKHTKIRYTEFAEEAKFSKDTTIIQSGKEITRTIKSSEQIEKKTLPSVNGDDFDFNISNAEVKDNDFCFTVENCQEDTSKAVKLQIKGFCNIRIKGKFIIKSSITCFKDIVLNGSVKEAVLLGNSIKDKVPCTNVYNEFSVGFKKQAINVIANVLEARNYLYLWIYAHHKVIYYANFLIPVLAKQALRQTKSELVYLKQMLCDLQNSKADLERLYYIFPMWFLNYENIQYLDDNYLWTMIKNYYHKDLGEKTQWTALCKELLGRKYKVSLYKSLAEYDLLFERFTDEQKQDIQDYMSRNICLDLPNILEEGEFLAGYLEESFVNEFRQYGHFPNISNVVFVDTSYKAKIMDMDETFIEMSKGKVASIGEISLLASRITQSTSANRYFYLYYDTKTIDADERKKEAEAFKNAIKVFFEYKFNNSTSIPIK